MSDLVITPVVHSLGSDYTGVGSIPVDAVCAASCVAIQDTTFLKCYHINKSKLFHACKSSSCKWHCIL